MSSLPKCPSETDRSIKPQTVTFTTGAAPTLLYIHTVLSHLYICIVLYLHLVDTRPIFVMTMQNVHFAVILPESSLCSPHTPPSSPGSSPGPLWASNMMKTQHGFQTAFDFLKEKKCSAKIRYTKFWERRSYQNCPSECHCPDFPLLLSCGSESRNPIKNVIYCRYIPWDRDSNAPYWVKTIAPCHRHPVKLAKIYVSLRSHLLTADLGHCPPLLHLQLPLVPHADGLLVINLQRKGDSC